MHDNESILKQIEAAPDDDTRRALMEELYTQNLGLIRQTIRPYIRAGLELEDALQEGYIALCRAVDHYQAEAGGTFTTYLCEWIRQSVGRSFRNTGNIKRLPVYLQDRIYKYLRVCDDFRKTSGRDPTDGELLQALNLNTRQLENLRRAMYEAPALSLSQPIGDSKDGEPLTIGDTVRDDRDDIGAALERVSNDQDAAAIWQAVETLEGKQAETIRRRYQDGETLQTTARAFGVSVESVRRYEREGCRILRKNKDIERIAQERGYSSIIYTGGGLTRFRQTGESIVEYAVIKKLEGYKAREAGKIQTKDGPPVKLTRSDTPETAKATTL